MSHVRRFGKYYLEMYNANSPKCHINFIARSSVEEDDNETASYHLHLIIINSFDYYTAMKRFLRNKNPRLLCLKFVILSLASRRQITHKKK